MWQRTEHWATVTATAFCNTQSPLVRGYIGRNGQICVCVSVCLCGGGRRWAMVANSDRRIHSFDSLWLLRELRRKKTGTKQQNMRTKKVEEISAVCAVACWYFESKRHRSLACGVRHTHSLIGQHFWIVLFLSALINTCLFSLFVLFNCHYWDLFPSKLLMIDCRDRCRISNYQMIFTPASITSAPTNRTNERTNEW